MKRCPSRRAAGRDVQRVQAADGQSMLAARSRESLPAWVGRRGLRGWIRPACAVGYAWSRGPGSSCCLHSPPCKTTGIDTLLQLLGTA